MRQKKPSQRVHSKETRQDKTRPKTKKAFTFYCVHQIYSNMAEYVAKNVLKHG